MKSNITTSDFYLASFLLANDASLIGHVRENDRSTFEFKGSDLDALIKGYYYDRVNVSPLIFVKAIRSLKNLMYNNATYHIKSSYNNDNGTNRKDDE